MKKWLIIVVLFMVVVFAGYLGSRLVWQSIAAWSGLATYTEPRDKDFIVDDVYGSLIVNQGILQVDNVLTYKEVKALVKEAGGKVIGYIKLFDLYQVSFKTKDIVALSSKLERLRQINGVIGVSFNGVVEPNDMVGELWTPLNTKAYLAHDNYSLYANMGFENAWRFIKGSQVKLNPIKVGILDRSVNKANEEMGGDVNYDLAMTDVASHTLSHGDQVLNIIAGNYMDDVGISGVASVLDGKLTVISDDFYHFKSSEFGFGDKGTLFSVFKNISDQVQQGVTVINCSFGPTITQDSNQAYAELFKAALKKLAIEHPKVLVIASAGNASLGLNGINHYPGGIPIDNLITVGSIDALGNPSSFSNVKADGGEVTLSAFGTKVLVGTLDGGKNYMYNSGTSFAAPYITGTVALIRSIDPELSAADIKQILIYTSDSVMMRPDTTMQTISQLSGGRLVRSDKAVLKVVNDKLLKAGKEAYTAEKLLAVTDVVLKASAESGGYVVEATVPDTEEKQCQLTYGSEFYKLLKGNETQAIRPEEMSIWHINSEENIVGETLSVRRGDTGAYSVLTITDGAQVAQTQAEGYPPMEPFKYKVMLSKEELNSLDPQMPVGDLLFRIFQWRDTIGLAQNYPNQNNRYGWVLRENGEYYEYKAPDVNMTVAYFEKGVIQMVQGTYLLGSQWIPFEIQFDDSRKLSFITNSNYGLTAEGHMKARYSEGGILLEYEIVQDGILHQENYFLETGILKSDEHKLAFDSVWKWDGIQSFYHENGKLATYYETMEGLQHGLTEYYDEQGNLKEQSHFLRGLKNGEQLNYEPTQANPEVYFLRSQVNYKEDKRDGLTTFWLENGWLVFKCEYREDVPHGLYEAYQKGVIWFRGQTENGRAVGDWTQYNEDGSMAGTGPVEIQQMAFSWAYYITPLPAFKFY